MEESPKNRKYSPVNSPFILSGDWAYMNSNTGGKDNKLMRLK